MKRSNTAFSVNPDLSLISSFFLFLSSSKRYNLSAAAFPAASYALLADVDPEANPRFSLDDDDGIESKSTDSRASLKRTKNKQTHEKTKRRPTKRGGRPSLSLPAKVTKEAQRFVFSFLFYDALLTVMGGWLNKWIIVQCKAQLLQLLPTHGTGGDGGGGGGEGAGGGGESTEEEEEAAGTSVVTLKASFHVKMSCAHVP